MLEADLPSAGGALFSGTGFHHQILTLAQLSAEQIFKFLSRTFFGGRKVMEDRGSCFARHGRPSIFLAVTPMSW